MPAVQVCAQDHDEVLPSYLHRHDPRIYWYDVFESHLSDEQILLCPSEATQMPRYGWNYRRVSHGWGDSGSPVTSPGSIECPSEPVVVADANPPASAVPGRPVRATGRWGRHTDGANFGLADGHARWYQSDFDWYTGHSTVGLYWRPAAVY